MFNTLFMEDTKYKAFVTKESDSGFSNSIENLSTADLKDNDLIVKVSYSSLNYKDALSASGNKGVTREYPHTPGIDAVGEVIESNSSDFKTGEKIIVTGYDLGMNTYGGFGQYISIPATWAISLPNELSEAEAMSIGTAGLTAGLCVRKLLQNDLTPDSGDVLVNERVESLLSNLHVITARLTTTLGSGHCPLFGHLLKHIGRLITNCLSAI